MQCTGCSRPPAEAIAAWDNEGGALRAPAKAAPRHIVRSGKRVEDTSAGCRANAAADMGRAHAPGGDFMRLRLERSAAVWTERADLLERLERKRPSAAGAAGAS